MSDRLSDEVIERAAKAINEMDASTDPVWDNLAAPYQRWYRKAAAAAISALEAE